jgi:RimJ/RimL family protein N-acetyltransferase
MNPKKIVIFDNKKNHDIVTPLIKSKKEQLYFEVFSKQYLDKSWEWLNDPEIRYATNTPIFTKDEQVSWFKSLKDKTDYLIWGVAVNDIKIGVVGLKNITDTTAEFFTYIGEKSFWGKGFGKQMLLFARDYACVILHLNILTLKVLHGNIRAINLYKGLKFFSEDVDDPVYTHMKMPLDC